MYGENKIKKVFVIRYFSDKVESGSVSLKRIRIQYTGLNHQGKKIIILFRKNEFYVFRVSILFLY